MKPFKYLSSPYILFLLLALAFFWKLLLLGEAFYPGDIHSRYHFWESGAATRLNNPYLSDVVELFYPRDAFYNSELKKGRFPLWDPLTLTGHPFHADSLTGCAYPPKVILHRLFEPMHARMLNLFLHLFLMGAFSFAFLRGLGIGKLPSTFGAVAWMFNGWTMAWFEFEHAVVAPCSAG
jgi:hypothetical protein